MWNSSLGSILYYVHNAGKSDRICATYYKSLSKSHKLRTFYPIAKIYLNCPYSMSLICRIHDRIRILSKS